MRGLLRPGAGPLVAGVEPAPCPDLADRGALRPAVAGMHAVIHLASRVHVMRDRDQDPYREYRRINVEGTEALLEEAGAAKVRYFVFVSSVKVVCESADQPVTEDHPCAPRDPYGITKLEAEQLVREYAGRRGFHAPILRLPMVYGPGVKGNMLRLFGLVDRGVPLPLGAATNRRSVVYCGNVVAAIQAVLAAPAAGTEVFFVSDGQDLSTPELIRGIAAALGKPARLVSVPLAVLRAAGHAGDLLSRIVPFPVTSAAVSRLLESLVVDSAKLARLTGFTPPYTVREGLRLTAQWYRTRAQVPG